jgi:small-conductance mechanosensitive channel
METSIETLELEAREILELVLKPFLAAVLAVVISYLLKRALHVYFDRHFEKQNNSSLSFIKGATSGLIYFFAILYLFYSIPFLNALGQSIFASATVVAAIVGFASQKAISNIIAGLLLVGFKPFRIGDVIQVEKYDRGMVEDIGLMHTIVRDYENRRIVIPNSIASESVIVNSHYNDERIRKRLIFRLTLDSDLVRAYQIIRAEIHEHPLWLDPRDADDIERQVDPIFIYTTEIGEYYINIFAYAWAANHDDSLLLQSDVYKNCLEKFKGENIKIAIAYKGTMLG